MFDAADRTVGALRHPGFASLARGRWEIRRPDGSLLATVAEDSALFALLRRFGDLPLPVGFTFTSPDGTVVGSHKRRFGLRDIYDLHVHGLDPRLAVAQGTALDVLEGR